MEKLKYDLTVLAETSAITDEVLKNLNKRLYDEGTKYFESYQLLHSVGIFSPFFVKANKNLIPDLFDSWVECDVDAPKQQFIQESTSLHTKYFQTKINPDLIL